MYVSTPRAGLEVSRGYNLRDKRHPQTVPSCFIYGLFTSFGYGKGMLLAVFLYLRSQ